VEKHEEEGGEDGGKEGEEDGGGEGEEDRGEEGGEDRGEEGGEDGGKEGEEDGGEEGEEDGGEEGGVIADIDTFFDSINTPAQCSFDTFGTDADPYTIEEDPLYVARVDLDLW